MVQEKCRFKIFLILSSVGHLVQQSGTIRALLAEDITRNTSVKLAKFRPVVHEEMSFLRYCLSRALVAILIIWTILAVDIIRNIFVKSLKNSNQWFMRSCRFKIFLI